MAVKEVKITFDETQKSVNASVCITSSFSTDDLVSHESLTSLIDEAFTAFCNAQKFSTAKTFEKLR